MYFRTYLKQQDWGYHKMKVDVFSFFTCISPSFSFFFLPSIFFLFTLFLVIYKEETLKGRGGKDFDLIVVVFFRLIMSDVEQPKKWRNIQVELFLIQACIPQRINRKGEREILCELLGLLKTQQCEGQMVYFDIIGATKRGEREGSIY